MIVNIVKDLILPKKHSLRSSLEKLSKDTLFT